MRRTLALVAIVFAAGSGLAAQEPHPDSAHHDMMMGPGKHGMMGMMGMQQGMMGPGMKLMVFAPDHLLAHKDSLGLSPQQIARLTALRDAAEATHGAAMKEAEAHMAELDVVTDTAALKTHFGAAHAAMGRAHWAMLSAAVQARAVLTDAQRTKIQVWSDSMQAWMQRHREMMQHQQPH
jgi:hypothetical protein